FGLDAVEELAGAELQARVAENVISLMRKHLVGPERTLAAEQEAYRFLHALIRDAAYGGMLKRTRAELHERLARWLEQAVGERMPEYEEIVGYHLEQAYMNRAEL